MLPWLPFPCDGWSYRREGFKDFQEGWFWKLFFASLQSEWPGYLPVSADLWRVAGAHCSHCFNKDSAIVLAAFERAEVAGRGVIFFRPLIELMQEQAEKIRSKKARADFRISTVPQISTKSGSPSLSLDLDFKEIKEAPKISPKLAERFEKERRDGLTRARKRGLRDYKNNPLEEWEEPSALAAAGD
jgi:hypothetical protein